MKLLILTDIPPCTNYTAGLVLNKWCDFLLEEGHEIYFALIQDLNLKPDIPQDKLDRIHFLKFTKPRENWQLPEDVKFTRLRGALRSMIHNNKIALTELKKISEKILCFSKENGCERIFISVQGQTITKVGDYLTRTANLPYTVQMWDPLEWWLDANGFDPLTKYLNLICLDNLIKNSDLFASMSWAMSVMFERKYKIKCVTNIPGLDNSKIKSVKKEKGKVFEIAFAGQLYAKEEFDALFAALELIGWKYKDNRIVLKLYGGYVNLENYSISNIEINGFVNQKELIRELTSADLLYCPYWFSKKFEKASRISFPSKLTSYLKTGRPVLMHSPSFSSPRVFLEKNNAAYFCDSLNPDDISRVIKKIMDDKYSSQIGEKGFALFEKYMTYDSMKLSFLCSIGLASPEKMAEFELPRYYYI